MDPTGFSPALDAMIGQVVVLDLRSSYACLGTLAGIDDLFYTVLDADLHDFRDSSATRVGIRRNRASVLVRRDEVVAITRLADVAES